MKYSKSLFSSKTENSMKTFVNRSTTQLTLTCGHAPLLQIEQNHQAWSLHMNMKYLSWHWSCSRFLRWNVHPWKLTFFLGTWASILSDKFQLVKVNRNANVAISQILWRSLKWLLLRQIPHSSKFQLCPQCCETLVTKKPFI